MNLSAKSQSTNSSSYELGIILPCYNFIDGLPKSLATLKQWKQKHGVNAILCVINDGSTDASREKYESCLSEFGGDVEILHQDRNMGKGAAVRAGFSHLSSRAEFILFTDCDLYYGLEIITDRFLPALRQGKELVILDRSWQKQFHAESSWRRLASKVFNHLKTLLTGVYLKDSQAGLKGFKTLAIKPVFDICRTSGFAFDVELLSISLMYRLNVCVISIVDKKSSATTSSTVKLSSAFDMTKDLLKIGWRRAHGQYRSKELEDRIHKDTYHITD